MGSSKKYGDFHASVKWPNSKSWKKETTLVRKISNSSFLLSYSFLKIIHKPLARSVGQANVWSLYLVSISHSILTYPVILFVVYASFHIFCRNLPPIGGVWNLEKHQTCLDPGSNPLWVNLLILTEAAKTLFNMWLVASPFFIYVW